MKITSKDAFEVRCHSCNVSYPVGTKRCMYCGEKPSAGPPQVDLLDLREVEERAGAVVAERTASRRPQPAEAENEEEAGLSLRQALPRVAMSLVWVVLLVVISIYRVCSGG